MVELYMVTDDPGIATQCDAIGGMRIFFDLERDGKAQRQAGRNTFISEHQVEAIAPVKGVLSRTPLMVRVNPVGPRTRSEVDEVLARGADMLMLPMFRSPQEIVRFCDIVDGRVPVVALLETREALDSLSEWTSVPGVSEVFVGLNDLHISLGCRFMFEPLASGVVDRVASVARARGLRFGFGGIADLAAGAIPGRDILAEHLRLRSEGVILSRTFRAELHEGALGRRIGELRAAESRLAARTADDVEADRKRIAANIERVAASIGE